MSYYIETYSGNQLYFLSPTEDMVELEDISNGLSKLCRYSGGITKFYSVAEHCVILARKVMEITGDHEQAITALLHDGSEAFCADLPRPIKHCCPDYMDVEGKINEVIFKKFNIKPINELIHYLDTNIVRDESVLFKNPPKWVEDFKCIGIEVECWDHNRAKVEWEIMYSTLVNMREENKCKV